MPVDAKNDISPGQNHPPAHQGDGKHALYAHVGR